jgi:uncharacterized protein (TIGR00251 family)
MTPWYRWQDRDLVIKVQVQPRAARDEFAGRHGDCLRVRLSAAPIEGRANEQLIAFLAAAFGVPRRRVQLLHGAGGRVKRLRIEAPASLPSPLVAAGLEPRAPATVA